MQINNKASYLFRPSQILRRLKRLFGPRGSISEEVVLPWGLPLMIRKDQTIGRTIWNSGVHDLPVCEALFRLLDPGEVAVDAGANIGQMTSLMARKVGTHGEVVAFEPHPQFFDTLERNKASWSQQKGIGRISLVNQAVSSSDGEAVLSDAMFYGTAYIDDGQEQGGTTKAASGTTIKTVKLDTYFPGQSQIGVMKIDVDGHEDELFAGMAQILKEQRVRDLVFEDFNGTVGDADSPIRQQFEDAGYTMFSLDWGLLKPKVQLLPKAGHQVKSQDKLPNYISTRDPERLRQRMQPYGWSCLCAWHRCARTKLLSTRQ